MKTKFHFIKRQSRLENFGVFSDSRALTTDEEILKAINLNTIKDYIKIPAIEEGDILTCCNFEDSFIFKGDIYERGKSGIGYEKNLIFKVNEVRHRAGNVILMGALKGNGVYLNECRFATKEEIKQFNKNGNRNN